MQALNIQDAQVITVADDHAMFMNLLPRVYGALRFPNYKDDCAFTSSVGDDRSDCEATLRLVLPHVQKPQRYIVNG